MATTSNHLTLDEFIGSEKYKEAPRSAFPGPPDTGLLHWLETMNQRSQAERDVTARILGALATHLDKQLATRIITRDDWTDEQFASQLLSEVLLKDTRADQWELDQQMLGAERFRALVRDHGGSLTVKDVARLVGTTADGVLKQISRGHLIAYKAGSVWYVLRAQFTDNGGVVAGIREALHALAPLAHMDQVRFFLSRIEGSDETPIQRLKRDPSAQTLAHVIGLAGRFMVQGGA